MLQPRCLPYWPHILVLVRFDARFSGTYIRKLLTGKWKTLKCKEWTEKRNLDLEMKTSCSVWVRVMLYNNCTSNQPSLQPDSKEIAFLACNSCHLIFMIFEGSYCTHISSLTEMPCGTLVHFPLVGDVEI